MMYTASNTFSCDGDVFLTMVSKDEVRVAYAHDGTTNAAGIGCAFRT